MTSGVAVLRALSLTAVLLLVADLVALAEESSLAERAEAINKTKDKEKKTPGSGRVLNNDDLKKAKGNVIYLPSTPTPAPTAPPLGPALPDGDRTRALDEHQGRAVRLRSVLEEAQKELAGASPDKRRALEEKLQETLNELLQTQETIGKLKESPCALP